MQTNDFNVNFNNFNNFDQSNNQFQMQQYDQSSQQQTFNQPQQSSQQYQVGGHMQQQQQQFIGQSSVAINNGSTTNYQHSINDLLVQPTANLQQNLFGSPDTHQTNQSVSIYFNKQSITSLLIF
jgi:Ni,Fe-hydrogenase I large subunit